HHEHDEARHEEVVTVVGGVEPQAALHVDRSARGHLPVVCGLACGPGADCAFDIGFHDAGSVGVRAVNHELHAGIAGGEAAREVGRYGEDAVDAARQHQFLGRLG